MQSGHDRASAVQPRPSSDTPCRAPTSPLDVCFVFNRMALQGFGGVVPVAQRELVDRERWLTQEQFLEALSVGQVLPGPNIINLAIIVGDRFFGWRGIGAAIVGLLAVPLVIVLSVQVIYVQLAVVPAVAGALRGMGAVAAGLMVSFALGLAPTLKRNPLGWALGALFAAATFGAVGLLRWPLSAVVLGLGAASIAAARMRLSE